MDLQSILDGIPKGSWAIAVTMAATLLLAVMAERHNKRRQAKEAKEAKDTMRVDLMKERAVAIAEARLDDAEFLTRQINRLVCVLCLLGVLAIQGCRTVPAPTPVTFGQRAIQVEPGQVLTVPPLSSPALTWFLMDNLAVERLSLRE